MTIYVTNTEDKTMKYHWFVKRPTPYDLEKLHDVVINFILHTHDLPWNVQWTRSQRPFLGFPYVGWVDQLLWSAGPQKALAYAVERLSQGEIRKDGSGTSKWENNGWLKISKNSWLNQLVCQFVIKSSSTTMKIRISKNCWLVNQLVCQLWLIINQQQLVD